MQVVEGLSYQGALMREAFNFVYTQAFKKRADRLARIANA